MRSRAMTARLCGEIAAAEREWYNSLSRSKGPSMLSASWGPRAQFLTLAAVVRRERSGGKHQSPAGDVFFLSVCISTCIPQLSIPFIPTRYKHKKIFGPISTDPVNNRPTAGCENPVAGKALSPDADYELLSRSQSWRLLNLSSDTS